MRPEEWEIIQSDKLENYIECICGHHVKRVTYLYNINTKETVCIGTTCVKKYGITRHIKNRILIQVLKEDIHRGDLVNRIPQWIQNTYAGFREKINSTSKNELDYYDIVAPFQRLLNDVCELVTEYGYDLILLLKSIEQDVESMNECVKHSIIDEYDDLSDGSLSTIQDDEMACQDTDTQSIVGSEISFHSLKIIEEYMVKENSMNIIKNDSMNSSLNTEHEKNENIKLVFDEPEHPEVYHNNQDRNIVNEDSEELSADTPSELSDDNIYTFESKDYHSIKSEFSAETPVEENPKSSYPFIILGDPFCDNYICNPVSHKYCNMKWRMRNLHTQIDSLKKEVNYLCKDVNEHTAIMQKNQIDVENLVAYSKKVLETMKTQPTPKYTWQKYNVM